MAIYTSRYANRTLRSGKYYAVGISLGKPRFPLGYIVAEQCYELAPNYSMMKLTDDRFKEEYIRKLETFGVEKTIKTIREMEARAEKSGKDLVLLCFEDIRKPGQWCHRTLFAEWWKEKTGETIEELEEATPLKEKKTKGKTVVGEEIGCSGQMSMFDIFEMEEMSFI